MRQGGIRIHRAVQERDQRFQRLGQIGILVVAARNRHQTHPLVRPIGVDERGVARRHRVVRTLPQSTQCNYGNNSCVCFNKQFFCN